MTWSLELSQGFEVDKCRHRVAGFLYGRGLDIGCGPKKIVETAIGIDAAGSEANLKLDLFEPDALRCFASDTMDYVFSSHCLEDMIDWQGSLREWWRLIRYGGHLVLYGPDPDYYPRVGTAGANPNHKHDLYASEVWDYLKGLGDAKLIHMSRHNETNEYSWQLIVKKRVSLLRKPYEVLRRQGRCKPLALPRKRRAKKECLIVRYGALGDAVWMTPILRQLKKEGWYIVYNTTDYSAQVLRDCPWIDEFMLQPRDAVSHEDLEEYWKGLEREFDRVINFSGSVEGELLKLQGTIEYDWSHAQRHRHCNVNYMDRQMSLAGYPELKGQLPELHFSEAEETLMQSFLKAHCQGKFVVEWSLSGSSFHKHYPWTPYITGEMFKRHPEDVVIVTVGDEDCQIIEPGGPNIIHKAGVFPVRASMLLTKYANLVIGPETGILNAASCYDTPKIVFLSHSSRENLTKYWQNCTNLEAPNCPCHPCHRLIYTNVCPKGPMNLAPACAENISAEMVYSAFERWYDRWKEGDTNVLSTKIGHGKTVRHLQRNKRRDTRKVLRPRRRAV